MDLGDIYYARVRLLIIMVKAFLDGYLLGDSRRLAIMENAQHVETESIELGNVACLIRTSLLRNGRTAPTMFFSSGSSCWR